MPNYVLKHPSPDYRGFAHGVDFHGGIGSTSDPNDAAFLVKNLGCELLSPKGEIKGAGAAASAPASIPANDAVFYRPIEAAIAEMGIVPPEPPKVAPSASQEPKTAIPEPKGKPGRKPKPKG